ncbi:MAG: hypothetical protein A2831_02675 [Candidatus Yanofskybacteria bacterium RIFCSPHIGHO2_01_FULL_44_17]|uniref:Uncharacterized protein n=1 Tax=Candidatus Yanofskybacteria bacterium RIFCSPHIGHO2_01_FULL_44_17 TaxID=1802668 RepID=A0A1F8EVV3_9BACT|nr:MAG: hypothetical protein A2831_02675 [Candidatus Yanofskybacteria bacterium RIFCSPHIGHO2_01_FULL_44_17]
MPAQVAQEALRVKTANGLCDIADLREGDLLEVTVVWCGKDDTRVYIFKTLGLAGRLCLMRRDLLTDWFPLEWIKGITLLARDAGLAFNLLTSLEEERKHLVTAVTELGRLSRELNAQVLILGG